MPAEPSRTEQVRKRGRKLRPRWKGIGRLLLLILVLAACWGAWRYVSSPGFACGDVTVHGGKSIDRAALLKMADIQEPVNLFRVSKGRVLKVLEGDVRVEKAEAHYVWPGVLDVTVHERKPAMYIRCSYHNYAKVDKDGLVLDVTDGIKDAAVPVLTGVCCGNVFIGDKVEDDRIQDILRFHRGLSGEAQDQVTELYLDPEEHLQVRMQQGFPVKIGPVNELAEKDKLFMTVFNELKDKPIRAEYIDLEFSKPFIKLSQ